MSQCLYTFSAEALEKNQMLEFERNKERFVFLKVKFTPVMYQLLNAPLILRNSFHTGHIYSICPIPSLFFF